MPDMDYNTSPLRKSVSELTFKCNRLLFTVETILHMLDTAIARRRTPVRDLHLFTVGLLLPQ